MGAGGASLGWTWGGLAGQRQVNRGGQQMVVCACPGESIQRGSIFIRLRAPLIFKGITPCVQTQREERKGVESDMMQNKITGCLRTGLIHG